MQIDTPLRYPGGKSIFTPFLAELIAKNNTGEVYAEPYAGGAGAAISLLLNEHVERILLNDLDKRIYGFWYSVLHRTDSLLRLIEKTPITVKEWKRQREISANIGSHSGLAVGFSTLYLNRCNRSGILNAGVIGGLKQDGKWKIDARFKKENTINKIRKISLYKNRIGLSHIDGIEFIKQKLDKNVMMYIDPPYYDKGSSLYMNSYSNEDHADLAKLMHRRKSKNWVISYDDTAFIRKAYKALRPMKLSVWHRANSIKKGAELLVISPRLCAGMAKKKLKQRSS